MRVKDRRVPRIAGAEYQRRRRKLMSLMEGDAIAVIPAAVQRYRSRDTAYPFRQDSDFFYLTGFAEPDGVLVLAPGRPHGEVILFCRERDERGELYDGERVGPDRAAQILRMDDAFPVGDIEEILPGMLEGRERIYINLGEHPEFDGRLTQWVASIRARESGGAIPPGEFVSLTHLLHEQRLYKSAAELRIMREAARITVAGHVRAMQRCRAGMSERQLEAELCYAFMMNGAHSLAYPSIVGAGRNACTLHYVANSAVLKPGEMVLVDAGCEYEHYAADVTRTFPVGGTFSGPQRAIYEVVLEANRRAIAKCRPGVNFNEPHEEALSVMVDGLLALGLVDGDARRIIEDGSYRNFCPHNSSHWLGSDVHDVGDYRVDGAWRALEPGMVLTIEPGIYIPDHASTAHLAERWRGLGIRIEDDVAITREGNEVLSAGAPKLIDDIETVMVGVNGD